MAVIRVVKYHSYAEEGARGETFNGPYQTKWSINNDILYQHTK
jgi:hypothetical protein